MSASTPREQLLENKWQCLARMCQAAAGPDRTIDLEMARLLGTTVVMRNDDDTGNFETTHCRYTERFDHITDAIERRLPYAETTIMMKVRGDGAGGYTRYAYAWLFLGAKVYESGQVANESLGQCAIFCYAMADQPNSESDVRP
jgi:hypothetical protein